MSWALFIAVANAAQLLVNNVEVGWLDVMGAVAENAVGPPAGGHQGLAVITFQVAFHDAQVALATELRHLFGFGDPDKTLLR